MRKEIIELWQREGNVTLLIHSTLLGMKLCTFIVSIRILILPAFYSRRFGVLIKKKTEELKVANLENKNQKIYRANYIFLCNSTVVQK